ncbi:hypothetical protein WJ978_13700 [Achromobacter xylosoxidans]
MTSPSRVRPLSAGVSWRRRSTMRAPVRSRPQARATRRCSTLSGRGPSVSITWRSSAVSRALLARS